MGFHDRYNNARIFWQIRWMHGGRANGGFQLAGSQHNRLTDELQRVRSTRGNQRHTAHCNFNRLVELIVLNVGLSAGILSPVRFQSSISIGTDHLILVQ